MIGRAALAGVLACAAAEESAEPRFAATVEANDLAGGQLLVTWTAHDLPPGTTAVCLDMGDGRHLHDLRMGDRALAADPDDPCCFPLPPSAREVALSYRFDLAGLARARDPDLAVRFDETYVLGDRAVLLRPEPLPASGAIEVAFRLPPGAAVVAPWPRAADGCFRLDWAQYDGGSYLALGRVATLGEVAVAGGGAAVAVVERPFRAARATLLGWVERALAAVAAFYREVPGRRVTVILIPVDSDEPGVFGSTLRRGFPSVALLFGARAADAAFDDEWVAPHELFHLGNPRVAKRLPWLSEGFTTYYEHVLRGRRAPATAAARWRELADGVRRRCSPDRGVALAEESRRLGETHHYPRVYWGGACLALRLDVAIRRASGGKRSLDDVMRELRRAGEAAPLDEAAVLAAFDRAAGGRLASDHLATTRRIPVDDLLRDLGLDGRAPRDDAPLAAIRKAIF